MTDCAALATPGPALTASALSVSAPSVSAVVARRRSIRAFADTPVDRRVVESVMRRAARAPSGSNVQPWSVRVVDGERIAALRRTMTQLRAAEPAGEPLDPPFQPAGPPPPEFLRRRTRNGEILYGALGIDRTDAAARAAWNEENFRFFGAPVGIFLLTRRTATPWQWLDLGIYLATALVLFEEAGLGTCAQADWAMHGEAVARFLGVPADLRLVCGIAVGHPDPRRAENRIRTERDDPLADDPDSHPPRPGDLA